MWIEPETTAPRWSAWQLSPPTTGLMHSDHFHPGCAVIRPTRFPSMLTISSLVLSGVRTSSAASKLFLKTDPIGPLLGSGVRHGLVPRRCACVTASDPLDVGGSWQS